MTEIKDLLRELGVGSQYCGCHRAAIAISLAMENERRLPSITKEIYQAVALECGCSVSAVERSIRTVIKRAWRCNPNRLMEIAGYPLAQPPTASEFIDIATNYLLRHASISAG